VAKRVVRQFDVTSATSGGDSETLDEAERELQELAEGLDIEEETAQREWEEDEDGEDEDEEDGWQDEIASLSVADKQHLMRVSGRSGAFSSK